MKERALELLACPACGRVLSIDHRTSTEGDELMDAELRCESCDARYPVQGGIPRLVPREISPEAEQTAQRFGEAWTAFDRIDAHYEEQFLGWIAPNRPQSFRDQVVLEGGCGKGRHSRLIAEWGAKDVIATDLGPAVEVAFRNTRHLPNVHVVQADLLSLPILPSAVDVAFSVGVLHHVTDPERAFRELAKRVRPGGRVIAWVYGRENNEWIINGVNPVREVLTSRLPFEAVSALSWGPAAILWLVSRGLYRPLSRKPLASVGRKLFYQPYINQLADYPFWELHSIVADHLTPSIAYYITREEFASWFEKTGLERVRIAWHNENSWRGTGIVPLK